MNIEKTINPSPAEYGALLIAIGTVMQQTGACVPAVRSGILDDRLIDIMMSRGVSRVMAARLCEVELSELATMAWESPL